jgi:hypothetical protein
MGMGRFRVLCLLSAAPVLAAAPSRASAQQEKPAPHGDDDQIIVVTGQRLQPLEVVPEDELDERDIAGYGVDTIGDLLREIGTDLGEGDEGPVVLINGELATGVDEIADLPPEAVSRLQLLPRQTAARLGQNPQRRVVNVVLKREHKQLTLNADAAFATAGKGTSQNSNAGYTRLSKGNRTSLTLRARNIDPLYEADRGLDAITTGIPFSLIGNVFSFPLGSEIDPELSALAGEIVTVAPVPADVDRPTLVDFVSNAGTENPAGISRYRTLIGETQIYSANGTLSRRLGKRTNFTMNLRAEATNGRSLFGAPLALLRLPRSSDFSPFTRDVLVARYLPVPLGSDRRVRSLNGGTVLNRPVGRWNFSLTGNLSHRTSRSETARPSDAALLRSGIESGAVNPFSPVEMSLLPLLGQDLYRTTENNGNGQVILRGKVLQLPAGRIELSLRLGAGANRLSGLSELAGIRRLTRYRRSETNGQATIDVPIAAVQKRAVPGLGELRLNLNVGFRDVSDAGTLPSYGYGLSWQPHQRATMRGSVTYEEAPPSVEALQEPLSITENVPFFDAVESSSVEARLVSGGNPDLASEKRRILNLGVNIAPFETLRLNLSADYTGTKVRDAVSSLPPLNAAVQAAFSERFVRNSTGRLVEVDARSVSFARDDRDQLRWGFTFSHQLREAVVGTTRRLGQAVPIGPSGEDDGGSLPSSSTGGLLSGLRLNLSAYHTWTINNTRLPREGLPLIDLLRGGALGFFGGQPQHQLQGNIGLSGNGVGVQSAIQWKSATFLQARAVPSPADLHFAPRATVSLRVFGDVATLLPDRSWSKGLRLSLNAQNLFDSKQIVRDGLGATPLRYESYRLDPLGRTVTASVRKVF